MEWQPDHIIMGGNHCPRFIGRVPRIGVVYVESHSAGCCAELKISKGWSLACAGLHIHHEWLKATSGDEAMKEAEQFITKVLRQALEELLTAT